MTDRPWSAIIRARSSWRSYEQRPMGPDQTEALREACAHAPSGPFGSSLRFQLHLGAAAEGKKLGTYGFIKGAQAYLVGAVTRGERDIEDYGYAFEHLVLQATRLQLGTCWLGGTLDRDAFGQTIQLDEDEWVPAVSPVGPTTAKRGLVDRGVRMFAGSRKRFAWEKLFFLGDFSVPLNKARAGRWAEPLEGVRVGPSASNKQPWRVLIDDAGAHVYLQPNPGYASFLNFEIQRIDAGIAMCHLELGAREAGLEGAWRQLPPAMQAPDGARYVASWATG